MAIILPLISFIGIFLILGIKNIAVSKKEILLRGVLIFSLTVAVATELLGFFNLIGFISIAVLWLLIAIGSVLYLYMNRMPLRAFISALKVRITNIWSSFSFFQRIMLMVLAFILVLIFAQGIIYPPNNRDSLTYHMARIPSWISHHSVEAYPTAIQRQLYQPPLAEYVIMHLNLLNHSDYFSASVQFFFLIFTIIALVAIVKGLGLGRDYQFMASILGFTLPEAVLQASSTQNDIVVAFFVITTFYFAIRSLKEPSLWNYSWLGLSAGLALFTKGTAYMYLAPILLLLGIFVSINAFRDRSFKQLGYSLAILIIIPLFINFTQYRRNLQASHTLLGIDKTEAKIYSNERMSPALFVCNTVKNIDLHMGLLCIPKITHAANKITHKVFNMASVGINEPAITSPDVDGIPGDSAYYMGLLVATHEDYGANFIQLLLIIIAVFIVVKAIIMDKKNTVLNLLLFVIILQGIIFCGYLKWQPLGSRLQTTIFLLSVPLICYAAAVSSIFRDITNRVILPVVLFYALILVLFNYARPYITYPGVKKGYIITGPTAVTFSRAKKLFALNLNFKAAAEYGIINDDIKKSGYKNIGLIMSSNDWEYPLFTDCYKRELNPVNIFVANYTKDIPDPIGKVDCIVSTTQNKDFIDYEGKRFYNQDKKNTLVYYYKQL